MAREGDNNDGQELRANPDVIRELRRDRGWTQEELASQAGLSKRTIENLENGKPTSVSTLAAIAKALKVDVTKLRAPTTTLRPLVPLTVPPPLPSKVWHPAVHYPLQPAPHFAGRQKLLAELTAWAKDPNDPNRVVSLVAAGGTGKTAVAERVLDSLKGYTAAGVFVWSFYDNPQTEAFLRAACEYFFGEAPKEAGGLLERLQAGLRADAAPHLIILDGMELVQATGTAGRARGMLDDPLMRRLLQWLAAGLGTAAKAIITSRFPVPDLEDRTDHGYRPVDLDDLDMVSAIYVLRRRGVQGDDSVLSALAESVHGHALTVDVLGLYLHRFGNSDPKNATKFDLKSFGNNQKAERLSKVLTGYAAKLPNTERDLLARLSLFPHGVTVEYLGYVVNKGVEIAGALSGCNEIRLLDMLEDLRGLGLAFLSETREGRVYSAHPFLRDYFRTLLATTKPEDVHEAVRAHVATSLDDRPQSRPTHPTILGQYERLIELTRLAGLTEKAFEIYWLGLGGYNHLGKKIGDNARGLRILAAFSVDGRMTTVTRNLSEMNVARLVNDWGLFAHQLGDLQTAREPLAYFEAIFKSKRDFVHLSTALQNICYIELHAGRWHNSLVLATDALNYAAQTVSSSEKRNSHIMLGVSLAGLGFPARSREQFAYATSADNGVFLTFLAGAREAECKLMFGDYKASRALTELNRDLCSQYGSTRDLAICNTLFGRCLLPGETSAARVPLADARTYTASSGNIEVTLRCYHLAAEIARHERNFPLAFSEALDGIHLADSCGFGRWSLDIRTELSHIHLAAGEPAKAIEAAEWVLKRSQEPDCGYAWGVADSLHQLGVVYARLGEKAKARDYLRQAIEKRTPLTHPGLAETQAEFDKLG